MTERYDSHAARHYAAYRPPLHSHILERVIRPHESFRAGLDVGCGTGYSAVALAKYCDRVLGLDPSRSMLDLAQSHPKIVYHQGSGDGLEGLPVPVFDVVTFAGSLSYAKSDRLRQGLSRVCPPGGALVVYDFEILLNGVMAELGVACPADSSDYDYGASLSDWDEFQVDASGAERLRLEVTTREMAHLLLSDSIRHDALVRRFPAGNPFESLVGCLGGTGGQVGLDAELIFTRFRFLGGR